MTIDSHIVLWNVAKESCYSAFAAMGAAQNAVQQRIVSSDLALKTAVENWNRTYYHFCCVHDNVTSYITNNMRMRQVPSNQRSTAAEPEPIRQVVADVRQVAVHCTVAEPVPARPVVADVSEEHNPAACVLDPPDLDPNRKA